MWQSLLGRTPFLLSGHLLLKDPLSPTLSHGLVGVCPQAMFCLLLLITTPLGGWTQTLLTQAPWEYVKTLPMLLPPGTSTPYHKVSCIQVVMAFQNTNNACNVNNKWMHAEALHSLLHTLRFSQHCASLLHHVLIDASVHPRSSQGHLVSSNWPVWTDQPTVNHSVWEEHFYCHHTPQYTFHLAIRHHRPGSGAGVLCKGSRLYTKWKWYLQQLGVSHYLWRWESNGTACDILSWTVLTVML